MTRRQLILAQLTCNLFINQSFPAQALNQTRLNETTLSADGDYRTAASGYWNKDSTWARFAGGAWITPATPPDSGAGVITIGSGHVVTINSSIVYDQVIIEGGGQVIVASGIGHTLADGPGTDLTINGTWINQGGTWSFAGGAKWMVNDGGTLSKVKLYRFEVPLTLVGNKVWWQTLAGMRNETTPTATGVMVIR